jgi:hypothetical protein
LASASCDLGDLEAALFALLSAFSSSLNRRFSDAISER